MHLLSSPRKLLQTLRSGESILTKRNFVVTAAVGLIMAAASSAGTQAAAPAQVPAKPATQTPGTQNVPPPNEPMHRGGFVPGQKRAPGDPAQIARGKTLYAINCQGCHGSDLRGGDMGGPNLLRSQVALTDLHGELIVPIIHGARQKMGMPAIGIDDADANAVAAYVRSVIETIQVQGAPPSAGEQVPSILVGNASEGKAFFSAKCSGCHSATGDLSKIADRISDLKRLQSAWITGSASTGEDDEETSDASTVTVGITLPSGEHIDGKLVRIDEFLVTLQFADGSQRTFRRNGDVPTVILHDPLQAHRDLLPQYSNKDIHDVTAYLVTLK
jgi:cytochrome c oxidase cbb3-type subunit 3